MDASAPAGAEGWRYIAGPARLSTPMPGPAALGRRRRWLRSATAPAPPPVAAPVASTGAVPAGTKDEPRSLNSMRARLQLAGVPEPDPRLLSLGPSSRGTSRPATPTNGFGAGAARPASFAGMGMWLIDRQGQLYSSISSPALSHGFQWQPMIGAPPAAHGASHPGHPYWLAGFTGGLYVRTDDHELAAPDVRIALFLLFVINEVVGGFFVYEIWGT